LGQNAKYSERADEFRLAPMNGHHQASILVTSGARLATVFEQRQPDLLEDACGPQRRTASAFLSGLNPAQREAIKKSSLRPVCAVTREKNC